MDFLADVGHLPGLRRQAFQPRDLARPLQGKSIADVLEMDVQEALEHFANVPKVAGMLQTLHDVGPGLSEARSGLATLSAARLSGSSWPRNWSEGNGPDDLRADEPTTGLHFDDVRKLLESPHGFTALGNTVVVIEHTSTWSRPPTGSSTSPEGGSEAAGSSPKDTRGDRRRRGQPHRQGPQAHPRGHAVSTDARRRKPRRRLALFRIGPVRHHRRGRDGSTTSRRGLTILVTNDGL